jgi:site-specific recombinase XerD
MSKRPAIAWEDSKDRFLQHCRAKGRSHYTLRNYTADLNRFRAWWDAEPSHPDLTPRAITEYHLEGYKHHLMAHAAGKDDRDGQAPATVNSKLSAVRSYLKWALKLKHIAELPECEPVAREEDEPKGLEKAQENALLRTVAHGRNRRDQAVVEILLHTGVRVGELVAICWRDVETSPNKGTLTIRAGKGRKWRTISLNKTARKAFATLRAMEGGAADPDARVFRSRPSKYHPEGGDLSARRVENMLQRYGRKAGFASPLHPHALRHTHAYRLIEQGVDIVTIARLLGHKSVQTTMRYLRRREGSLQAAVDRIG